MGQRETDCVRIHFIRREICWMDLCGNHGASSRTVRRLSSLGSVLSVRMGQPTIQTSQAAVQAGQSHPWSMWIRWTAVLLAAALRGLTMVWCGHDSPSLKYLEFPKRFTVNKTHLHSNAKHGHGSFRQTQRTPCRIQVSRWSTTARVVGGRQRVSRVMMIALQKTTSYLHTVWLGPA